MALFTSSTVPSMVLRESRSPSERVWVSFRNVDVVPSMLWVADAILSNALMVPPAAVKSEEMSSRLAIRLSTKSDCSASSATFTTVFMASRTDLATAFTNFSLTSLCTVSARFSVTMEAMAFFLPLA